MKVFISWSGERSKSLASALKHWLPFVFQGINVWMSEQDIKAGSKWNSELGSALSECKVGIICLTSDNLNSRWLAFEAGALSSAISDSRVIPYRLDLESSDISPPLSQFQDTAADEEGTFKLVRSINDSLGYTWNEHDLQVVYKNWWGSLKSEIELITQASNEFHKRTDREILEEILDLCRQAGIRDLNSALFQILSSPNVMRIEVAPKQTGGATINRLALRITVAKKLPITQIPTGQLIPSIVFGMPTDVVEST